MDSSNFWGAVTSFVLRYLERSMMNVDIHSQDLRSTPECSSDTLETLRIHCYPYRNTEKLISSGILRSVNSYQTWPWSTLEAVVCVRILPPSASCFWLDLSVKSRRGVLSKRTFVCLSWMTSLLVGHNGWQFTYCWFEVYRDWCTINLLCGAALLKAPVNAWVRFLRRWNSSSWSGSRESKSSYSTIIQKSMTRAVMSQENSLSQIHPIATILKLVGSFAVGWSSFEARSLSQFFTFSCKCTLSKQCYR